jgi:hypothetical protein
MAFILLTIDMESVHSKKSALQINALLKRSMFSQCLGFSIFVAVHKQQRYFQNLRERELDHGG